MGDFAQAQHHFELAARLGIEDDRFLTLARLDGFDVREGAALRLAGVVEGCRRRTEPYGRGFHAEQSRLRRAELCSEGALRIRASKGLEAPPADGGARDGQSQRGLVQRRREHQLGRPDVLQLGLQGVAFGPLRGLQATSGEVKHGQAPDATLLVQHRQRAVAAGIEEGLVQRKVLFGRRKGQVEDLHGAKRHYNGFSG